MLENPGGHSVIKHWCIGIKFVSPHTLLFRIYIYITTYRYIFPYGTKENMEKGKWLLKNSEKASQSSLLLKSLFS